MRIIAGEARSRKIKSRKGHETRPTLANIKESLFSIIAPHLENSIFLDLFSGSGNIALEALSRGAKRAVMIEQDTEALRCIIENVNSLGFADRCRAYKNDVFRAIEILSRKGEKFDIIFLDPPYQDELCSKTIKAIARHNILAEEGLIICEHHALEDMPEELVGFQKVDERRYQKKVMTYYARA